MNLSDFVAGTIRKEYQYASFLPSKINQEFVWDDSLINVLLEKATIKLGELNAFTLIVPSVDIFIQMHIRKEANTSSKIEGTKTELDEVLASKEYIAPEKRDDWQEVQNYIKAINYAVKELDSIPLSNRLIKNTHKILLDSVRGERKQPGEFRKTQNWIGGSNLGNAFFIPPHHTNVKELMSDLEKFLHNQDINVPYLIRIAIAHYQFETIHPFLDGNGRIGRLLIALYLISKRLLIKPSLYLSDFFEKNKTYYYDSLTRVRTHNDLVGWVKFFLEAVIATAESGVATFSKILQLKQDIDIQIKSFGKKAHNADRLVQLLYQNPIITTNGAAQFLGVSKPTAIALLKDFEEYGVLKEATGYGRGKMYLFQNYIDIYS